MADTLYEANGHLPTDCNGLQEGGSAFVGATNSLPATAMPLPGGGDSLPEGDNVFLRG
jgi:hypothetical protein